MLPDGISSLGLTLGLVLAKTALWTCRSRVWNKKRLGGVPRQKHDPIYTVLHRQHTFDGQHRVRLAKRSALEIARRLDQAPATWLHTVARLGPLLF